MPICKRVLDLVMGNAEVKSAVDDHYLNMETYYGISFFCCDDINMTDETPIHKASSTEVHLQLNSFWQKQAGQIIGEQNLPLANDLLRQAGGFLGKQLFKGLPTPVAGIPDNQLGERGSGTRSTGAVQDFQRLRSQCLSSGRLWEDPSFPADDSSIFYSKRPAKPFQWKRPSEICQNPELFVGGASRFDIRQGELGDCWLLAAVCNLTLNPVLFHRVVPEDQSFTDQYAGVFHFRFWQYGRWIDVCVDDRLPTYNGRLVFLHSTDTNEFWSALLEKAYAKLYGSYESLKGGCTCEAMEDFTGGITEMYDLAEAKPDLFQTMIKAQDRSSLMGCSIEPDPNTFEAELPNGLVMGHAYSITAVKAVEIQARSVSGKIPLLRIRNPWGNETEWKGAWSDKSREWTLIPQAEKDSLGLNFDNDGEFWMSFSDFLKNFQKLEICNLSPDVLDNEPLADKSKKRWETNMYDGSWVRGATSGGCRNYIDTFACNPQYRILVEDPDEDDDDNLCTIVVALMQKNRRLKRKMGAECLTIGYAIYNLKDESKLPKPLDQSFFKYNASVGRSPNFINLREITCRHRMPPGSYCIVPSTFEPNEPGEFLLRVFSEKANEMKELDDEIGVNEPEKGEVEEEEQVVPSVDDPVSEMFKRISGEDLEVDPFELKEILDFALKKEFEFDGFSLDMCKTMVALLDVDRSGKLGLQEFTNLWTNIRSWKTTFSKFDTDNSNTLSTFELRSALTSAGYHLNWHVLKVLVLRYGTKDSKITFDNFITCAVKLKSMIDEFKEKAGQAKAANFSMEEWVEKTMYA